MVGVDVGCTFMVARDDRTTSVGVTDETGRFVCSAPARTYDAGPPSSRVQGDEVPYSRGAACAWTIEAGDTLTADAGGCRFTDGNLQNGADPPDWPTVAEVTLPQGEYLDALVVRADRPDLVVEAAFTENGLVPLEPIDAPGPLTYQPQGLVQLIRVSAPQPFNLYEISAF